MWEKENPAEENASPEEMNAEECLQEETGEAPFLHAIHYNGRIYCPQCHAAQTYEEGICLRCGCLFLAPEGSEE